MRRIYTELRFHLVHSQNVFGGVAVRMCLARACKMCTYTDINTITNTNTSTRHP